jgi:hypothetical protein
VDGRFLREVERFDLRFTCRDCFHFAADGSRCAHEWPNAEHLDPPSDPLPGVTVDLLFCKEFELG